MTGTVEAEGPTWFVVDEREGRRTLAEQMTGLTDALTECPGKTVCDFGCAEGLIALEFAKAGATVYGCDYNPVMIERAHQLSLTLPERKRPYFEQADIHDQIREGVNGARYDIVLALAVVHKLRDPRAGVEFVADTCNDLAVFRLPVGSTGLMRGKYSRQECDVPAVMKRRGFALEQAVAGPRDELVQYYRRQR